MVSNGLAALLVLLLVDPGEGDKEPLPKPASEGLAALKELTRHGVEGGALRFGPRTEAGPGRLVLADGERLRRVIADHRVLITPALCDALLTTSRELDQSVLLQA